MAKHVKRALRTFVQAALGVTSGIAYSASAAWSKITGADLAALQVALTVADGEAVIATK